MPALLSTTTLSISIPGRPILHVPPLWVGPGEVVCLVGPAMSGKTTLCLALSGLLSHVYPAATITGSISHDGATRPRIRMLFEEPALQISGLRPTVAAEIALPLQCLGTPEQEILDRIKEVAGLLQVADLLDRDPLFLSGGELKRVVIAGLLAVSPTVLILDEPYAALDPPSVRRLQTTVRRLAAIGIAIILTSARGTVSPTPTRILDLRKDVEPALLAEPSGTHVVSTNSDSLR